MVGLDFFLGKRKSRTEGGSAGGVCVSSFFFLADESMQSEVLLSLGS